MSLSKELTEEVDAIFSDQWTVQSTKSVPFPDDLRLNSNHAKHIDSATVLYADLDGSTDMVDNCGWEFSAEIYKAYLRCAGLIIKSEGGIITSYDGDRIMAIFTGSSKNKDTVRCALKINFAVHRIIQPALNIQYPSTNFKLKHSIGVDMSQLRAARIGVRADNDIVWVGRAANYAAKLTALSEKSIWITQDVHGRIGDGLKYSGGADMWQKYTWRKMNNMTIYGSSYIQPF